MSGSPPPHTHTHPNVIVHTHTHHTCLHTYTLNNTLITTFRTPLCLLRRSNPQHTNLWIWNWIQPKLRAELAWKDYLIRTAVVSFVVQQIAEPLYSVCNLYSLLGVKGWSMSWHQAHHFMQMHSSSTRSLPSHHTKPLLSSSPFPLLTTLSLFPCFLSPFPNASIISWFLWWHSGFKWVKLC